jgi:hypothetical protein
MPPSSSMISDLDEHLSRKANPNNLAPALRQRGDSTAVVLCNTQLALAICTALSKGKCKTGPCRLRSRHRNTVTTTPLTTTAASPNIRARPVCFPLLRAAHAAVSVERAHAGGSAPADLRGEERVGGVAVLGMQDRPLSTAISASEYGDDNTTNNNSRFSQYQSQTGFGRARACRRKCAG